MKEEFLGKIRFLGKAFKELFIIVR